MEKLTYSVKELAKVMGVSLNRAYDMTHIEGFPVIKVGARKLIPKAALEKWLLEAGRAGEINVDK
ncbi:hypothetical protein IMSAG049_00040 [Clostridiales bacterium]|nr:hypothetical protein IMSAG049_00040 [Clostridiales bacterium]